MCASWELAFTLLDKLDHDRRLAGSRWELAFTLLDKLVINQPIINQWLGISIHPS